MSTAIALSCGNCGAPLNAPAGTRYLTCAHCGSRLEVMRSDSAYYTTVLEKIEKQTEEIADDVEVIRLQNDLERLDREWQMERETYLRRNKNGTVSEPSEAGEFIGGFLTLAFGFLFFFAQPVIGFIIICVGGWYMFSGSHDASRYHQRKKYYEARREQLAERLDRRP